jgi:4-amino-4-deoxy-L-arabinose transferase-like glycosyltransferase
MTISFNGKRVILGAWLLVCLVCVANYYLGIFAFGRFAKPAMILSIICLILVQHFVGPTLTEVQEHRDQKRRNALPRS